MPSCSRQKPNPAISISKWELGIVLVLCLGWVLWVRPGPLSLPYFWDEADVYLPGSWWLAENHMDIRPGVFPDDWSRGHPPLLFVIAATAFIMFGPSPTVGHLLILPFLVLTLAGTYLLGCKCFGRRVGLGACMLLGTTPLVLSVGNMLLPEIMLAGLTVLAFLFFHRGQMIAVALTGTVLVLTKETGVFSCLAISGALCWEAFRLGQWKEKKTWTRLALSFLPVAALGAFFVWQKILAGYFIFPHHQNLLWARPFQMIDLATVFPSLLLWHGRYWVVGAAVLWGIVGFIWSRKKRIASEENKVLPMADGPRPENVRWTPAAATLPLAMVLLILANTVFFAKMFWLERYALPAHPAALILACGVLFSRSTLLNRAFYRMLRWLAVGLGVFWGFWGLNSNPGPDQAELTFAYADIIATHQLAFRAIAQQGKDDPRIITSWPMTVELRNPELGYVDKPFRAIHIDSLSVHPDDPIDLILVAAGSRHAKPLREQAEKRNMKLIQAVQWGSSPALELYAP